MRITFVTQGLVWKPGGSPLVVFEYANHLSARGHQVRIVFPYDPQRYAPTRLGGAERIRHATRLIRKRFRRRVGWFDLDPGVETIFTRGVDPEDVPDGDAVFSTYWSLAQQVWALPPEKGTKFDLVYHYEGNKYPAEAVDAGLACPMIKVAISRWTKRELSARGFSPIVHVPLGIDHSTYRQIEPLEDRGMRVGMNYVPKQTKDPATGLRAIEVVREKHPELEVIIFGTARPPRDLPSWVTYLRNPSTDELVGRVYNRCSIFLCSSREEGFGYPPAEAMACGCMLVSTDCGGIREFAEHEVTALLSPPGDSTALAINLERAITDRALRGNLSRGGLDAVSGLTWENSTTILEELLSKAVLRDA